MSQLDGQDWYPPLFQKKPAKTGGTLQIESIPGHETLVSFTLPIYKEFPPSFGRGTSFLMPLKIYQSLTLIKHEVLK